MKTAMRHTLSDQLLSRLSEFLAMRIGLYFPSGRWDDLERGMKAAAHKLGDASVEAYIHRVLSAPLTHQQIEILASHLTVGETYFFRDWHSFEALEQYVLPELIRSRRDSERRLRIWCAGCCTGEEPYSIAMLLDRLLPDYEQWHITLLATDINPQFLRKAAEGIYGNWSFRGTPAWVKERYFKTGSQGRFEIHPRIKKMVTFSYLNLADDVYPSLSNNTNAMDIIFCRNVLMYFTEELAEKVVGNLYHAVVDGGWLAVSPAEASHTLLSRFSPVNFTGATFYRKVATDDLHPPPMPPQPLEIPALRPSPETPRRIEALPAAGEKTAAPAGPLLQRQHEPDDPCLMARLCANQGKLAEAAEWCGKAIVSDKLNPQNHYLLATILEELGQDDAAEQSLKRALYLEPNFVLAHFALGNLRLSQGRHGEAKRHFANALALLQRLPLDEILPESDGLTAGRLGEIISSALTTLPRAAEMSA